MISFPKIKILIGYLVRFDNKDIKEDFFSFTVTNGTIGHAEEVAWSAMKKLGQNPSEYKMSTRREIKMSITF